MVHTARPFRSLLATLLLAGGVLAQPAPTAPAEVPAEGQQAPPSEPTSPTRPETDVETPQLPEVEDLMLEAVPPPAHVLGSWQEALRLIRTRSTSLAIAESQVRAASAQSRLALAQAYPSLSATGSVQRHLLFGTGTNITAEGPQINVRIPDPAQIWQGRLSFRQPLIAPRAWYEAETARYRTQAAKTRVENTERLLLAQVADTIVAVVTAERLAEVSRVSLASSLSILDLTRRRARLGAGNALDVLRAEQEVALNRAQMVTANETLRQAREALGMALGYPEEWGVESSISLDALATDAKRVCSPVQDLEQRADIRAAKADAEVAKRNIRSTDWLLSPTLDLVSDLTYTTAPFTSNGLPTQWTIGGLLTIPLYDGGSRYANRSLSAAQLENSQELVRQAQRDASLEVQQSLRAVQVAEQNLEVSRKSRDLARETARLARLSFVNGRSTSFELVDAAQRHRQAELDLAVKEFDVVRARITALLARANCDI